MADPIKGDGSYGSIKQEKGKMRGIGDIGYMIAIPEGSYKTAPYALDWMNTKIKDENYKDYLLGVEGVSYNIIPEAEKQDGDIGITEDDGSVTYYRLLDKYKEVQQNSMYATGGNPKIGRKYWPLREASYDCWDILLPDDESDLMITSVLAKCPCLSVWNGVSMLRRFLPEVLATTDDAVAQVIVADNGSSDESLRVLAEEFPSVEVIRLEKNYGFAEGYNRAISQVGNDYVVLLNSDVATSAGWVNALLRYMEENPRCAACQPKILYSEDRSMFEYAGAAGGFVDRNGYPYCRGRIFSTVEPDNGQYDNAIHVDWATGAALMTRRDLYIVFGGLDPLFYAHMEEIDL
ncbi:MAG: glycosyltransferase, partial [Clostridiales bacterium]|nr:glycosyltransferase [Clostridiales bacterium]